MKRFSLTRVSSLLAIAGVLALGSAFAKEPADETKSNDNGTSVRAKDSSDHAAIPSCLEKLKLSQSQQDQVKDIVGKYATEHAVVWKQFSDRYMETIGAECMLLAAIEDNLNETQRGQIRGHRHQTALSGKSLEGTNDEPIQATAKPGSAAEGEITVGGVSLTAEQEAAADKLQGKYLDHLRSLNRDIEGLHARLVALEADKLVEIEKILTKEQLTQLREIRQNAPVSGKAASSKSAPPKTE
ncbi:MAG: hypothetical protein ACYC3X_20260 [Pirellulaceae bacterium]